MHHENEKKGPRRAFVVLLVCAALSLAGGIGLLAWGIGRGNPIAAIVGGLLLVDAGVVAMVAWRFR